MTNAIAKEGDFAWVVSGTELPTDTWLDTQWIDEPWQQLGTTPLVLNDYGPALGISPMTWLRYQSDGRFDLNQAYLALLNQPDSWRNLGPVAKEVYWPLLLGVATTAITETAAQGISVPVVFTSAVLFLIASLRRSPTGLLSPLMMMQSCLLGFAGAAYYALSPAEDGPEIIQRTLTNVGSSFAAWFAGISICNDVTLKIMRRSGNANHHAYSDKIARFISTNRSQIVFLRELLPPGDLEDAKLWVPAEVNTATSLERSLLLLGIALKDYPALLRFTGFVSPEEALASLNNVRVLLDATGEKSAELKILDADGFYIASEDLIAIKHPEDNDSGWLHEFSHALHFRALKNSINMDVLRDFVESYLSDGNQINDQTHRQVIYFLASNPPVGTPVPAELAHDTAVLLFQKTRTDYAEAIATAPLLHFCGRVSQRHTALIHDLADGMQEFFRVHVKNDARIGYFSPRQIRRVIKQDPLTLAGVPRKNLPAPGGQPQRGSPVSIVPGRSVSPLQNFRAGYRHSVKPFLNVIGRRLGRK